jgi:hypothetical protein
MPALVADLALHRIVDKRTGLLHPGNGLDAMMIVLGHDGLLVEGAAPVAFHHPQVGVGGLDDRQAFINVTPVQTVHGQDNGEQEANTDDGGNEAAFMQLEVVDR